MQSINSNNKNSILTIQIPLETTNILLKRCLAENLDATLFPSQEKTIATDRQIISLCSQIKAHLLKGLGFCILKINQDFIDSDSLLTSAFWNLFTSLAQPLPQYITGERYFKVYDAGIAPTKNHYSNTNRGGGFHTDGTFLPETPLYVGLICIRQAQWGGESILIDGRKLYHELKSKYPQELIWLQKEYHFDCCDQIPGIQTRPKAIFNPQTNFPFIQYLREYIIKGHQKAGISLEPQTIKSLDLLDQLTNKEESQYVFKLNKGEMLLFNNHILLHGRNTFIDHEENNKKRLLLRVYGKNY